MYTNDATLILHQNILKLKMLLVTVNIRELKNVLYIGQYFSGDDPDEISSSGTEESTSEDEGPITCMGLRLMPNHS